MARAALPVYLAAGPQDYTRLGIQRDEIAPWEDGLRTDGGKGSYEWWYFDAHLHDASKLVIVFYTKSLIHVDGPLAPYITFALDRPDGSHFEKEHHFPPQTFSASKEGCDVRIGGSRFSGDLHTYQIHLEMDGVRADVRLTGTVPAWRPETGCLFFGQRAEHLFAWLPSVPQGDVTADITIGTQSEHFTGIGYHDHNWGNVSMVKLMNHWYWARGKVGDYTIIASHITAEKRYGSQSFTIFMLAKHGHILVDDSSKVTFSTADMETDQTTGKPVAQRIVYDYHDGPNRYLLTFQRRNTILRIKLADTIPGIQALLARLIGFDGAFQRFTGDLAIQHSVDGTLVAAEHEDAIWELMYFGHVH